MVRSSVCVFPVGNYFNLAQPSNMICLASSKFIEICLVERCYLEISVFLIALCFVRKNIAVKAGLFNFAIFIDRLKDP